MRFLFHFLFISTKWTRFFLFFFLVPILIYASYDFEDYLKDSEKILAKWTLQDSLVQEFTKLKPEEKEQNIYLLKNAINCCNRGKKYCKHTLKEIRKKSKEERRSWKNEKGLAERKKNDFDTKIDEIKALINGTFKDVALSKALPLYQESEKKANLAALRDKDCAHRLDNIEEVISTFKDVSKLYEEASSLAQNALNLMAPHSDEENKNIFRNAIETYKSAADRYKKESILGERLTILKEDIRFFEEKELKWSAYELQKQMLLLLERLVQSRLTSENEGFKEDLEQLKYSIEAFEREEADSRLAEGSDPLSQEEFKNREKERREHFFKSGLLANPELFLPSIVEKQPRPFALPLDGHVAKDGKFFTLYAEQFYRFLVQSDVPVSQLLIKVYEKEEIVCEEKISIPTKKGIDWERYLTDGMIFIPETKLKSEFGLDLRLNFVSDPACDFSMIISQKAADSRYQFSISLDEEAVLYECNFFEPPPWQLDALRKPELLQVDKPIEQSMFSAVLTRSEFGKGISPLESFSYPILDLLVEQFKKNPLLLAQYVYHEITLVDPFLKEEKGVFQAPAIHRNPLVTYLEKQGSPWEQCHLLIYLLRKAGYRAECVMGDLLSLPKTYLEKMLLTKLPEEQKEGLVNYPWVVLFDGEEQISLFPWMKEMQVDVGHDLYSLLPEEYASADRWILRYLKRDEKILKHIGPDGDDTAAVLFTSFVQEELRKQGLSLSDVGIHRRQLKKQFVSWQDFSRPSSVEGKHQIVNFSDGVPNLFASAIVEVFSHENPHKKLKPILQPFVLLNCSAIPINFAVTGEGSYVLCVGHKGECKLALDQTDRHIGIKVTYFTILGSETISYQHTFSISKGTATALCFSFGGESSQVTSQYYDDFTKQKEDHNRISSLLAFVGAAYFEKCGRAERTIADLHKTIPRIICSFGLAKLVPDLSKGSVKGNSDLMLPQVDMIGISRAIPSNPCPTAWHQEMYNAVRQWTSLTIVDRSSNEHQILREIFKDSCNDSHPVSTVKLLQLAHLQHLKNGLPGEGFLTFTSSSFAAADKAPEAAQSLYFSHLKDFNLGDVKVVSLGQWNAVKNLLDSEKPLSSWAYAYMTPGLTFSQDGTYKEMGTLIFHPEQQSALISSNNLILNGGLGSPLPGYYFTSSSISQWELFRTNSSYKDSYYLQVPSPFPSAKLPDIPAMIRSEPGTRDWASDIRALYKDGLNFVADPVDVVTGAFYIDETDLVLPGPISLSIRRNYNSQNPLIGEMGCGWKLSLNPYLIEQDQKRFAAELDGTVIAYSYNQQNDRWEVLPENNPELFNFNQQGIGGLASLFHSYIENDVLHGADGSKRFYENGLLQKSVDIRGNSLSFFYKDGRLSRVESSNGDFCGFHYNYEGNIDEIYAKDGRRVYYKYNSQGDLVKVTLPNAANIIYEYDRSHRIIRETKPHGKVLENIYDDEGRVKKQKSPMGPRQEMIVTALFEYADGVTTVTDANGSKTTYKFFQKQIYKVTDPLGFSSLQAWFIDEKSWFNPETETVLAWDQEGGAIRSLKSTTDKRGLTTHYLYDSQGNPEVIALEGEDLTGKGDAKVSKRLGYNEQNLCTKEETQGQKTITTYDPVFSFLPKRIEKYSGDTLISYVDFSYNSLGQLEKEDQSGQITILKYNNRGFPREKIQLTGTEDQDVVTTYDYNQQGQCIQVTSVDGIQKNRYDLMGNLFESIVLSPSEEKISATYIGYDLNNAPTWKQTANSANIVYFDYHASGRIKAKRQSLAPSRLVAYTLYEYDRCGYLIEETDPRGCVTYRDHDLLGQIKSETKAGYTTLFSYEPGGLVEAITSPSGAKISRHYTTNGLLKEEIYPDETKNTVIYDFFGRPVLEKKNDIVWEITYDDAHHRVIRTHLKTKNSEISEFDSRGNLIKFTDAAGYTSEKTYDGLNRLKTEITPSGKKTLWSYQDNRVICTLPNGETTTTWYVGGLAIQSEVTDSKGILIATSQVHLDPKNDKEEIIQGDEKTVTWRNSLGLPIKIEKGEIVVKHEYDLSGNCIATIDGDGRVTRQEFDKLGRLEKRIFPDESSIRFVYDVDSNLSEYHLPNGNIWKASYDSMCRKKTEELFPVKGSPSCWTFSYKDGYLFSATDPMERTHTYLYDFYGKVSEDSVNGSKRTYTYDPRGPLAVADQTIEIPSSWLSSWIYGPRSEHSRVERTYDEDGNLALESIYLNANLMQESRQEWTVNSRSLQIGDHTRDFFYQNGQLVEVSTPHAGMTYSYDLSGSLKSKKNPFGSIWIDYNTSGLPETIFTELPKGSYQELLGWYPSGKLSTYASPGREENFSYNKRGYLRSTGSEEYDFDFGLIGTGVRTEASGWYVPQDGLDDFGRVLVSAFEEMSLQTEYNEMGEVIIYGEKQLSWDPWGKLIKITDPDFLWEASYDAFGRRLQTRYTKSSEETVVTNSLYDPEKEFQEIGVQIGDKTFWKLYGPDACDAITDEMGESLFLMHNGLKQLIGVVSSQGTLYSQKFPSAYGPLEIISSIPQDLISYAQSLNWHSKGQDPTGFIWMGDRYYDSRNGRFLSQDSVSYPICLDLYAYANGDPINYFDPDGRFSSSIYQPIKATVLNVWNNPQFQGSLQMVGGFAEMSIGAGLAWTPFAPLGVAMFIHGADHFAAGGCTFYTGRQTQTLSERLLQTAGMTSGQAAFSNNLLSMGACFGATGLRNHFIYTTNQAMAQTAMSLSKAAENIEGLQAAKTISNGNITPVNFFKSKTYAEIQELFIKKYGPPRGVGPYNKSFYNPETQRTFNLHMDPLHHDGKPHVDIRRRGLPSDYYDPFFLKESHELQK